VSFRKKKQLVVLAEVFGTKLSDQRILLYCEALKDLSDEDVEKAIAMLLRDATVKFFPLPSQLREYVTPTLSIDDAGQELISRLNDVFARFGYVDPEGARAYLGELVWEAMGGQPGYLELCMGKTAQMPTIKAQIREVVKAKLRIKNPGGRIAPSEVAKIPPPRNFIPMLTNPEQEVEDLKLKRSENLTTTELDERKKQLRQMLDSIGGQTKEEKP
jgi:hypothetical protein